MSDFLVLDSPLHSSDGWADFIEDVTPEPIQIFEHVSLRYRCSANESATNPATKRQKLCKACERLAKVAEREKSLTLATTGIGRWSERPVSSAVRHLKRRVYERQRLSLSPKQRLINKTRVLLRRSLAFENSKQLEALFGYTALELKQHLRNQFKEGMTDALLLEGKIHIDHIKPIKLWAFEREADPAFVACFALKNLQPLWAHENIKKRAYYTA